MSSSVGPVTVAVCRDDAGRVAFQVDVRGLRRPDLRARAVVCPNDARGDMRRVVELAAGAGAEHLCARHHEQLDPDECARYGAQALAAECQRLAEMKPRVATKFAALTTAQRQSLLFRLTPEEMRLVGQVEAQLKSGNPVAPPELEAVDQLLRRAGA